MKLTLSDPIPFVHVLQEKHPIPLQLLGSSTDGSTSCNLAKQLGIVFELHANISENLSAEHLGIQVLHNSCSIGAGWC